LYIAIVSGSRITVIESETMHVLHVFPCVDKIDKVLFSPDSQYVLCGMFTRNAVQIFSVADGEWRCRVNEGVAGIVNVTWSPDSRSVLTQSDFGLQVVVWSLVDSSSYLISSPKTNSGDASIQLQSSSGASTSMGPLSSFSDCGVFLALVHRIALHDHIGVYTTKPWGEANKFKCRSTDVAALAWSPCSRYLITADSSLRYMVHVYSVHGTCLASFEAYKHALGLRQCVFPRLAPLQDIPQYVHFPSKPHERPYAQHVPVNASQPPKKANVEAFRRVLNTDEEVLPQLLALGSYDGRVRLLSTASWQCAHVLPLVHPLHMEPGLANGTLCTVELTAAQAKAGGVDLSTASALSAEERAHFEQEQLIFDMTSSKGAKAAQEAMKSRGACYVQKALRELPQRALSKKQLALLDTTSRGVSWLGWSADATLLAARDAMHPQCVWIWHAAKAQLVALLVQLDNVVCAQWRPLVRYGSVASSQAIDNISVLAFSCNSSRVYFWSSAAGVTHADLPYNPDTSTVINKMYWANDGSRLLLQGAEGLCCAEVFLDSLGGAAGVVRKAASAVSTGESASGDQPAVGA
jgi:WD40 repeat protein